MEHSVSWYNPERTIIHVKLVGSWTWQDLHHVTEQSNALQDSVMHGTHVIYDFAQADGSIPEGAISHARRLFDNEHPNDLLIIVVGVSRFASSLLAMVSRIYKRDSLFGKFRFAETLSEAHVMIAEYDRSRRS